MPNLWSTPRYRFFFVTAFALGILAVLSVVTVHTAEASQHRKNRQIDIPQYMERLDKTLSLTEQQRQQITSLLEEKQSQAQAKREEAQKQRDASKEERAKMREERKKLREERKKERVAQHEELHNKIASLLTPEQREKFEQMKANRKSKRNNNK